ncbi:Amino acid permease [Methanosarcina lacustris Z-7289]|uniref:Amino acid permease n=1 Tax=Methanosarcina lacustris Z-7289 TaxID=1434111 RepID=A0A0E3S755_9EURY|nr:APC family permease [Methanosarcina lacustris]AKB75212.1 Amino acid permease [Methanosarcina lacustris Z-7289]
MQNNGTYHRKLKSLKTLVIGEPLNPFDSDIFHKVSLIALFAWVGLGSDAMSSASYGPEEAYLALGNHIYLAIFVAMSIILTIFVISSSYSQIIELFPAGGGGYLVASKLLSPSLGMLSGCALLIDYVLTIAISIASGVDAMLSFLPASWSLFKLGFAFVVIMVIILLNLRGIKESVLFLIPIFALFIIAHVTLIIYSLFTHLTSAPIVMSNTVTDVHSVVSGAGLSALLFIIIHSYSMGAGTYTGIEAVSNAVPAMREPRVKTAKRTMHLMAISLAFMAAGLMLTYIFYNVSPEAGKTLNAVLFENITKSWGTFGHYFVIATLVSEAGLLFVAAQTGFLDGPRVLANMALDRWVPTRFATLSDRLVTQNGILIMGISALAVVLFTQGSVKLLIVLYSIAVFITFILSQAGMVRHWWKSKTKVKDWKKKFVINGVGLVLTILILMSVIAVKFSEGGWVTLLAIGAFAGVVILIRRHYDNASELIKELNAKVINLPECMNLNKNETPCTVNMQDKTAVLLVNGFNGLGMQALSTIFKLFGGMYKNFVFVQIGVIDAGVFKGAEEIKGLQTQVNKDVDKYVKLISSHGYYAECFTSFGTDIVEEVTKLAPEILKKFPNAVFFGGQIVFPNDSALTRWLHNYTVFASQRKLYADGIPFVVLPIKV